MTPRRHPGRPATPAADLAPGARADMVRITVEIPRDTIEQIDQMRAGSDRTRAAEIRQALAAWTRRAR